VFNFACGSSTHGFLQKSIAQTRVAAPAAYGTSFEALFSEAALYAPPSLIDDPMLPRAVGDAVPSPSGRLVVEDVANICLAEEAAAGRVAAAARSARRGSI
jgi:hypothetical protein